MHPRHRREWLLTTQSISTPGTARAASLTAGQLWTTSPSEEVLTKRMRGIG